MPKMKVRYRDWLDQVQSMRKIRQDNDVIDHIRLVYSKTKIELLGPIIPGIVCDKTRQDNDMTNLPRAVYA